VRGVERENRLGGEQDGDGLPSSAACFRGPFLPLRERPVRRLVQASSPGVRSRTRIGLH